MPNDKLSPQAKCKIETARLNIGPFLEKFKIFRNDMMENKELFAEAKIPMIIIESGEKEGKQTIIPPYEQVKKSFSPEEYFDYLKISVRTPEDIRKIINEPFMQYISDTSKEDKLNAPHVTMAKGGGDCDNLSLVAQALFEALGCREGFNYEAKVIGVGEHAVCIFKNKDGRWYSLDQHAKIKEWKDIHEASSIFSQTPEEDAREIVLYKMNLVELQIFLDNKTLKPTFDRLGAKIYLKYKKPFDAKKYLPPGANKYKMWELEFTNDISIFYKNGILVQSNMPDGRVIHWWENGKKRQEKLADGVVEHFDKSGSLTQKNLLDGSVLIFHKGTEVIRQKNFPEGNDIEIEVYFEDGKTINQRVYRKHEKYKMVWYDKEGKMIQYKTLDGEVKVL